MSLDVKLCGLRTPEAVAAALDGGASHVGFIFFPRSPRHVRPEQAGLLARPAAGRAKTVAVTVDADDEFLDRIRSAMEPDIFQLHGSESPQRVAWVKSRYRRPVMKAFSITAAADLEATKPYAAVADRFLFDAKPPKGSELPGGNGVAFDWSLLAGFRSRVPYMLSGGLNAANIGDALRIADPPGIDVSSGIERAPGEKDVALIDAFFKAVAAARSTLPAG